MSTKYLVDMNKPIDKLTEKEEETMLLLWEHGPCSVKELLEYFSEPRPHINTLSTFVRLLEQKGFVGHKQGRNGGYNYFAIQPKSEYRSSALSKVMKRYFGSAFSMVSNLVEEEQLDADQLRTLLDMVEKKKES